MGITAILRGTKRFSKNSLVTRLALNTLIFTILSAFLSAFLTTYFSKRAFTREETARMKNLTTSTVASLKNTMAADDYPSLSAPAEEIVRNNTDVSSIIIEDKRGNIVLESDPSFREQLSPRFKTGKSKKKRSAGMMDFKDTFAARTVKAVSVPFRQGKLYFGTLTLFYYPSSPLEREKEKKFISLGYSITTSVSDLFANFQYFEVAEFAQNIIRGQKDVAYCAVADNKNLAIFHTDPKLSKKRLEDPLSVRAQKIVSVAKPLLIQRARINNEDMVDVALLLEADEQKLGLVRLGYSLTALRRQEFSERIRLFFFAVFLSLLGIYSVVFLARRITRPVLRLATLSEKVGKGELDEKMEIPETNDEVAFLARSFNDMIDGLREREHVKDVFSRYVTKDVAKKVLETGDDMFLQGERRRVTVMFADIRGFTSLSEKLYPEEVVALLNEYFDILVDVVFKYEGTLDKFIGDCIMAVFGAPFYHGDDEERAVQCAIEMQEKMREFNEQRKIQGKKEVEVGIGINTGFAIAGNIGSKKRIEYTVIGDTVNTASRIQGLAQRGEIVISESTYVEVKDRVEVVSLPPVSVKGKEEPVAVFKLMSYLAKKERRRYKRIHTDVFIKYKVIGKDKLFSDALANLSGGGCLIMAKERLYEGDGVALEVSLSEEKALKGIEGKILECARTKDGFYKVRVEYENISQDARDDIVKFVYEEIEKGAEVLEM